METLLLTRVMIKMPHSQNLRAKVLALRKCQANYLQISQNLSFQSKSDFPYNRINKKYQKANLNKKSNRLVLINSEQIKISNQSNSNKE
jgi:hypothetical protein